LSNWADDVLKNKTRDISYDKFRQTILDFYETGFNYEEIEVGVSMFLADDGSIFSNICLLWLQDILDELFQEEST
jgi:hypothetical protein